MQRLSNLFQSLVVRFNARVLTGGVLITVSPLAGSAITDGLCKAYNNFIGNELVGFAVGAGALGLVLASALDEGGNTVKTGAIRLGAAGTAGVSINELVRWGSNGKVGFCSGTVNLNIPIVDASGLFHTVMSMLA